MSDISFLLKAIHFAADKHRDQRRKGVNSTPYINHPIHVAQILSEVAGMDDPEILAAAILHDTVEDTETTLSELEQRFGDRVARIVGEVTDNKALPKAERKRLQIEHARKISEEGALVKVADKISNVGDVALNPPCGWDDNHRSAYLDWAEQVVSNCPRASVDLEVKFRDTLAVARTTLVDG